MLRTILRSGVHAVKSLRENVTGLHNQSVALLSIDISLQHRSIPLKEVIFLMPIKNLRFGA